MVKREYSWVLGKERLFYVRFEVDRRMNDNPPECLSGVIVITASNESEARTRGLEGARLILSSTQHFTNHRRVEAKEVPANLIARVRRNIIVQKA